ncbi:isopenicillin N synthase-like protein [Colletotrichum karsti]|uniref:Isopenicillin N synthase-like protein n=1 Tax=Colletotrichum karsti TaxID=1095194 RepID=A0A9P6I5H3_9PEZI|nr:isopenicillin N synthase-like protein [Colletotrichum karsti]KAF9876170.1 isopenicillin N synthase-like protein [Colletotrichum karsti]
MAVTETIPVIDISPYLVDNSSEAARDVIKAVYDAVSTWGFFLLKGTPVTDAQQTALLKSAKSFFDLPLEEKMALDVATGGVRWRGYMPMGGEFTHGGQDWKEGLYVGPEHPADHPLTGMPLHGGNRFPDAALPSMRKDVMEYVDEVTELGKTLTDVLSCGLGLEKGMLREKLISPEPIVLFRCFKYAPESELIEGQPRGFGIGDHTDFGYLTILKADSPGLQILSPSDTWVNVPVLEDGFVVNVGDMLDRMTDGRLLSRPHRVQRPSPDSPPRFSFPLFFDFAWDCRMERLPLGHLPPMTADQKAQASQRWKETTFREVKGTWSQYLARKVQKVFPDLELPDFEPNAAPSTRFRRVVSAV